MIKKEEENEEEYDAVKEWTEQQTGLHDLTDEEVNNLNKKIRWKIFPKILAIIGIVFTIILTVVMVVVGISFALWSGWLFALIFGLMVPGIVLGIYGAKRWNAELVSFKTQREVKLKKHTTQEALGAQRAAEEEQRQRKANEEAEQRQRETKDRQRLDTLKSLVEMSEEILLEDLATALELPRGELIRKITEWGKQFGIKLKGDRVIIAQEDVAGFIAQLDEEMKDWAQSEKSSYGKQV